MAAYTQKKPSLFYEGYTPWNQNVPRFSDLKCWKLRENRTLIPETDISLGYMYAKKKGSWLDDYKVCDEGLRHPKPPHDDVRPTAPKFIVQAGDTGTSKGTGSEIFVIKDNRPNM